MIFIAGEILHPTGKSLASIISILRPNEKPSAPAIRFYRRHAPGLLAIEHKPGRGYVEIGPDEPRK
jgi:hypothetical protein